MSRKKPVETLLQQLGFVATYHVEGRASIADLFCPEERCGIYVLHCSGGEFYVGQATDVTRRYVQHRDNHSDIQQLSFKTVPVNNLDAEERRVIAAMEGHYSLRNISLVSFPRGETDFDLVMTADEQQNWLNDLSGNHSSGTRPVNPEQRQRYRRKYARFLQMPYANEAVELMKTYVKQGIPAAKRSEISFWSCTCLPSYAHSDITIYSRINIYLQEVLTAYLFRGCLAFSFHLQRSPLKHPFGAGLLYLRLKYPGLVIMDAQYPTGGSDQINIVARDYSQAIQLLRDEAVMLAIRRFNLGLMRKGPCIASRYHCLDLADRLLSDSARIQS